MDDDVELAASNLRTNRLRAKYYFDRSHRLRTHALEVGDLVLMWDSILEGSHSRKLDDRWKGPYRITKVGKTGYYRLAELDGTPLRYAIAGNRIKLFVVRGTQSRATAEGDPALVTMPIGSPWAVSMDDDLDEWDDLGFTVDGEAVCRDDLEVPIATRTRSRKRGNLGESRGDCVEGTGNDGMNEVELRGVRELNGGLVVTC